MKSLKYDFFNSNSTRSFLIYNDTGSNIPAGRIVKVADYNSETNAIEASIVNSYSDKPLGVTNSPIQNGKRGDVIITGIIDNVNTGTATLMAPVFFSTSGTISFSGPVTAKIGYVVKPGAAGKIFVNLSGSGGEGSSLVHSVLVPPDALLKKGMPVYWNGIKYLPARANDPETVAIGIVSELGSNGYIIQLGGMITLTTSEWDVITGGSGGLTPGLTYYLSDLVAGRITIISPEIQNSVYVAVSPTEAILQLKVLSIVSTGGDSIVQETFLSTLNQTDFNLTYEPFGKAYTWVALNGFLENEYTIVSGTTIKLGEPIDDNVLVDIRYVRNFNVDARNQIYIFDETVASGSKSQFTMPITPGNINNAFIFVDGSLQIDSYSFIGPTVTFDTPVVEGQRVYAKIFESVNLDADLNNYVKIKTVSIANGGVASINTIFEENISARYEIQVQSDPRIFMTARLKVGSGADFFTTSSLVSESFNTPLKLNVDYDASTIRIQNLLGSGQTFTIMRQI